MVPVYELCAVLRPRMPQAMLTGTVRNYIDTILKEGGVVRRLQNLGEKRMAYRMKAHQEYHYTGHYIVLNFDASTSTISNLRRMMKLDENVIRHLLIKDSKHPLGLLTKQ